jgi:predicted CxxxxCH...CXXCH cytochrome family protein
MFDLLDQTTGNAIKTSCNWCHYDSTGTIDQRLLCQRCHADPADTSDSLNGVIKALYPLDPPYGFSTAPNVKMHSSSVLGPKYGSWGMSCMNCHNPHTQEQDLKCGNSIDYGKLIKEYICYDNAATGQHLEKPVQFITDSGAGSFADGAPHDRNICETCHTRTNHHQNDGLAPGDLDTGNNYVGHYDGSICTSCHSHAEGFKPGCGGCHEVPPPTGTHLKHFGGAKDNAVYGSTNITQDAGPQGAVYLMNCGNCHPMASSRHNNYIPNSGGGSAEIELYNPNAPAGSLKALNLPGASYTPGTTVYTDSKGLKYTNGSCDNVYCHSNQVITTSGPVPQPSFPTIYPPLVYNPPWESLVVQSRQYQNPVWGVDSLGCDGCHGYPILNQYPAVSAGAGDSHGWTDEYGYLNLHVWNMSFDPLQCNTCHYDTVRDNATWTRDSYSIVFGDISVFNTSKHVNGTKDINFNPNPILYQTSFGDVYQDLSVAGFDSNTKTCSNVACHLYQTEVKWGTPYRWGNSSECNVCHQY